MSLPLAGPNRAAEASWICGFSRPWPGKLNLFRKLGEAAFRLERSIEAPGVIGELVDPLPAGPVGLFDRANIVRVRLYGGALASAGETELLGGANVAAIGSELAGYEIIQFRDAALVGPGLYELQHLLRGQSGSEPEMQVLAPAGTRFVLFDPACVQMDETLADLGSDITWRVGPASRDHGDPSYAEFSHRAGGLGLRPWRPAQLRAARDGNDTIFTWIRRTRIDGDSWELAEVPLGEEQEVYRLEILSGTAIIRTVELSTPTYRYLAADQIADFGSMQSSFALRVSQLSMAFGRGASLERTVNV
jgi:hypothetical protein